MALLSCIIVREVAPDWSAGFTERAVSPMGFTDNSEGFVEEAVVRGLVPFVTEAAALFVAFTTELLMVSVRDFFFDLFKSSLAACIFTSFNSS